jgi:hypothetical protein
MSTGAFVPSKGDEEPTKQSAVIKSVQTSSKEWRDAIDLVKSSFRDPKNGRRLDMRKIFKVIYIM